MKKWTPFFFVLGIALLLVGRSAFLLQAQLVGAGAPAFMCCQTNAVTEFSPDQLTNIIFWGNGDYELFKGQYADGAAITNRWFDQTIHTNDAFYNDADAGTPGPLVLSNQLNGRAIIRFTGNDFFAMKTGLLDGVLEAEAWVVFRAGNDPAGALRGALWDFANTNVAGGSAAYPNPTIAGRIQDNFFSTQNFYYIGTPGFTTNGWHIASIFTRTNEMLMAIDGVLIQGGSKLSPGCKTNPMIGMNNVTARFTGDVANIFIMAGWSTESNRNNCQNYLTNRYALGGMTNTFALTSTNPGFYDFTTNQAQWTNGMLFMYWATNLYSLGLTNDAPIGTNGRFWNDQGPLGNHLTNVSLTTMPIFQSNIFGGGGATPSGTLPGVLFDGTDDRLFLSAAKVALTNTNDFTLLVIYSPTVDTGRPLMSTAAGGASYVVCNRNTENRFALQPPVPLIMAASGEYAPASSRVSNAVCSVMTRKSGIFNISYGLQNAYFYDNTQTNNVDVTLDSFGFSPDFGNGFKGWLYGGICWTNRAIMHHEVMNWLRLIVKPNLNILP